MDGRPNRRNKAGFLNFSGAVWMLPQTSCLTNTLLSARSHISIKRDPWNKMSFVLCHFNISFYFVKNKLKQQVENKENSTRLECLTGIDKVACRF